MTPKNLEQRLKQTFGKTISAKGNWVRIPCPTCHPSDTHKMKRYVSTTSDYSKCYICGITHMTTSELLGGNVMLNFDKTAYTKEKAPEDPRARILPYSNAVPVNQLEKDHPAVKFLHKDHLYELDRYALDYGIVYVPADTGVVLLSNPYTTSAERLVFPVKYKGELVGWQMRALPGTFYGDRPNVIRYYHIFPKGSYLYNHDNVDKSDIVVVVEGVKKALKLPKHCVATLGKGVSGEQIELIKQWKKIIIMMDADKDDKDRTQMGARSLTSGLNDGRRAINIDLGDYGIPSPDEATEDQLRAIIYKEWNK